MTVENIKDFVESQIHKDATVHIHFKQRNTITGLFIQLVDYEELKSKNFWRIVQSAKIEEWVRTKNMDLPKIFNGFSFSWLSQED